MTAVFTSRPDHYKRNVTEGRRTYVYPATLAGPDSPEPGVVIFAAGKLRMVLPAADAIRIADAIVDALETVQETP